MSDPRIRPPEGQHVGYISGCVCVICEANPLRTLEMHARQFVAAVSESEAVASLRWERDDLAKLVATLNATIADRNEEYRRVFGECERRGSQLAIARHDIERLNQALGAAERKLDDLEQERLERSERE